MTESSFLMQQIVRATAGPAWHGLAISELLADVTAAEARARPVKGMHTIVELVAHIGYWAAVAERRLRGEDVSPNEAEQWPALDVSSDIEWAASVRTVLEQHASLVRAVARFGDERLHTTLRGRDYSAAVLLHGIVEHDAYHGGQIALLKKLVRG